MSLGPGQRLGPYEVLGPLGAGGMGQVWRARDTRPVAMVAGSRFVLYPDESPDGRWVAFSFFFHGGQADIAVVGTDGTGLRQLTDEPHFGHFMPRWSPDGNEIVFYSSRSGDIELWSIRPDGSGLRQLTEARSRIFNGVWSPDRRRIAYSSVDGGVHLFQPALPWKEQSPEKLPRPAGGNFFTSSWSPDGERIAGVVSVDSRADRIAILSLSSQEYEVLPVESGNPRWMSDGRRMIFERGGRLLLLDVATGRVKEILGPAALAVHTDSVAISHDDRTIYLGLRRNEADIWMVTLEEDGNR